MAPTYKVELIIIYIVRRVTFLRVKLGWFACTKVLPPGPIPGLDPSFSRSMCAYVLTTVSEYITSRGFLSVYVRYAHGGLSRLNLAAWGSFVDTNADSPHLPQRGLASTGYRHEPWYVEPLRPDKDSHPVFKEIVNAYNLSRQMLAFATMVK